MANWVKDAECRGLPKELAADFYSFVPAKIDRAKTRCAICPVQRECVESVGDANAIAGGKTKLERLMDSWHMIEDGDDSNFC